MLPDGVRPFTRKLPEFKFWWSGARATAIALAGGPGMTLHVSHQRNMFNAVLTR